MIENFKPFIDDAAVFDLWQRCLGGTYSLSERVFRQNTCGNPYYEAGDGLVIRDGSKVIGFCLIRLERSANPDQAPREGAISVLLVDPAHQRKSLGTQLLEVAETRLRQHAITKTTVARGTTHRFWPGIPVDLESARAFFESRGYQMRRGTFDLVRHLGDYSHPERVGQTLQREGVVIEPAREDEVAELLSFERHEFPGWEASARLMCAVGDTDHIIVVRDQGKIIGSLQTFSPSSRFRAANVVWEQLLGKDVGGIGAVGIAKSERGRGLGLAICAVASEILKRRGVGHCHIDWTGLVDFYGKLGYQPWREYWIASKDLL